MENINSGKDYAKLLKEVILEGERGIYPESKKLPELLLEKWFERIEAYANQTWNEYITGKRDSYEFTHQEAEELFDKAGYDYTLTILDGLVDKDLVEVSISESGEMLYGLTEKGVKIANKTKGYE